MQLSPANRPYPMAHFGKLANQLLADAKRVPFHFPSLVEKYFQAGGNANLEKDGVFLLESLLATILINPNAYFYDEGDLPQTVQLFLENGFSCEEKGGLNGAGALVSLTHLTTYRHITDITKAAYLLLKAGANPYLEVFGHTPYSWAYLDDNQACTAICQMMIAANDQLPFDGIDCLESLIGHHITDIIQIPYMNGEEAITQKEDEDGKRIYLIPGQLIFNCDGKLLAFDPANLRDQGVVNSLLLSQVFHHGRNINSLFPDIIGAKISNMESVLKTLFLDSLKQVSISFVAEGILMSVGDDMLDYDMMDLCLSEMESQSAIISDTLLREFPAMAKKTAKAHPHTSRVFKRYLEKGSYPSLEAFWDDYVKEDLYTFKGPTKSFLRTLWQKNKVAQKENPKANLPFERFFASPPPLIPYLNDEDLLNRYIRSLDPASVVMYHRYSPYFRFEDDWRESINTTISIVKTKPKKCPLCAHAPVANIEYGRLAEESDLPELSVGKKVIYPNLLDDYAPTWQCANCGKSFYKEKAAHEVDYGPHATTRKEENSHTIKITPLENAWKKSLEKTDLAELALQYPIFDYTNPEKYDHNLPSEAAVREYLSDLPKEDQPYFYTENGELNAQALILAILSIVNQLKNRKNKQRFSHVPIYFMLQTLEQFNAL